MKYVLLLTAATLISCQHSPKIEKRTPASEEQVVEITDSSIRNEMILKISERMKVNTEQVEILKIRKTFASYIMQLNKVNPIAWFLAAGISAGARSTKPFQEITTLGPNGNELLFYIIKFKIDGRNGYCTQRLSTKYLEKCMLEH